MTVLAVVGDCTTTTCLALAASWSVDDDVIVLEADPSGGSLTGWLDTPASPSLATIVANVAASPSDVASTITSLVQRGRSGIRFIAAPIRSVPADRAIDEAAGTVFPWLAADGPVVLADVGRSRDPARAAVVQLAAGVVVMHRQAQASAAAAAVRLERLAETIERISVPAPVGVGVIGAEPFDPDDIRQFLDDACPGAISFAFSLDDDPLGAAVLAGRSGVSAKRLRRLPLLRGAARAAATLRPIALGPRRATRGEAVG